MFNRLFLSAATKQVLAAFDDLAGDSPFGPHLRARALRSIRGSPEAVKASLVKFGDPKVVALFLVMDEAGRAIASGDHHTYRGILGMQGQEFQRAFHWSVRELRIRGAISQEEEDEARQNLAAAIKRAG